MSYTEYNNSYSCSACIRAIDLIKIANQIFNDKMEYVQIKVTFDANDEDHGESIKIYAIPNIDSDDIKVYPQIEGLLNVEIDDDFDDDDY